KQPDLQRAFGTHSLWDLVRAIARRYLHAEPDVSQRVACGRAGMMVLSWLADALAALDAPQIVALGDPVIGAATQWLQAGLAPSECTATAEAWAWMRRASQRPSPPRMRSAVACWCSRWCGFCAFSLPAFYASIANVRL